MAGPADREDATRTLLLDTAERLFAERGIAAVSLREVGARAGQRNNSAAQYHFGSKQGLVEAIIAVRSVPIDRRRAALLAALPADPTLEDLLRVVVLPLAETIGSREAASHYLRFLAQVVRDPMVRDAAGGTASPPLLESVSRQVRALMSELPTPVFARRLSWCMLLALECLADHEGRGSATRSGSGDAPEGATSQVVAELVHTQAALLRAPLPTDLEGPAGVA